MLQVWTIGRGVGIGYVPPAVRCVHALKRARRLSQRESAMRSSSFELPALAGSHPQQLGACMLNSGAMRLAGNVCDRCAS